MASLFSPRARLALLIGNQNYGAGWIKLEHAHNDVDCLEKVLSDKCGFQVTPFKEATKSDLMTLRTQLAQRMGAADTELAIVYFAGHATIIAGEHFLIPADAKEGDPKTYQNPYEFIQPLHDLCSERNHAHSRKVAQKMDAKPSPATVILTIVDGCRTPRQDASTDRPFQPLSGGGESRPADSRICFLYGCDMYNKSLEDDDAHHGFLTEALLHSLQFPGMKLPELMDRVKDRCRDRTEGMQRAWFDDACPGASTIVLHQERFSKRVLSCTQDIDVERISSPEAAGVFLKAQVDKIKDMIACQRSEPEIDDGVFRLNERVHALVSQPEALKDPTLTHEILQRLQGLQDLLPKHRTLAILVTRTRSFAWLRAA